MQSARRPRTDFCIEVGDEAFLTVDEIWPDGDAPENPTTQDVIDQIKATSSRHSFAMDWGFDIHVSVDGLVMSRNETSRQETEHGC